MDVLVRLEPVGRRGRDVPGARAPVGGEQALGFGRADRRVGDAEQRDRAAGDRRAGDGEVGVAAAELDDGVAVAAAVGGRDARPR